MLFTEGQTSLLQYPGGLAASYAIPNGVTNIGDAFAGCLLTNLTLPASLTELDSAAFSACASLTGINVSSANPAFSGLNGVLFNKAQTILVQFPPGVTGSYVIPGTVTNFGSAFDGCSLSSLAIPAGVITIGDLSSCPALVRVAISNGVANIGAFAFDGDLALPSVAIPASVTNIGEGAFSECYGLTNITVPEGNPVYSSADGVLFDKNQRTLLEFPGGVGGSFAIPDGVTSIGGYAFSRTSISSVSMPASVTNIGASAFYLNDNLTNVTIGSGVVSIGAGAFSACGFLTNITIPDSVASIGDWAFGQCAHLATVTIGSGVTSMGKDAFGYCFQLQGYISWAMRRPMRRICLPRTPMCPVFIVRPEPRDREQLFRGRGDRSLRLHCGRRRSRDHQLFRPCRGGRDSKQHWRKAESLASGTRHLPTRA